MKATGQCIKYRSRCVVLRFCRVLRIASRTSLGRWWVFHNLLVIQYSLLERLLRGDERPAPTENSLEYAAALSKWVYPVRRAERTASLVVEVLGEFQRPRPIEGREMPGMGAEGGGIGF